MTCKMESCDAADGGTANDMAQSLVTERSGKPRAAFPVHSWQMAENGAASGMKTVTL